MKLAYIADLFLVQKKCNTLEPSSMFVIQNKKIYSYILGFYYMIKLCQLIILNLWQRKQLKKQQLKKHLQKNQLQKKQKANQKQNLKRSPVAAQ